MMPPPTPRPVEGERRRGVQGSTTSGTALHTLPYPGTPPSPRPPLVSTLSPHTPWHSRLPPSATAAQEESPKFLLRPPVVVL